MNDYSDLKLTHLRREQAARLQRDDEFRDALKDETPAPVLPTLRLRIECLLPRPLRPTAQAPLRRAADITPAASCRSLSLPLS